MISRRSLLRAITAIPFAGKFVKAPGLKETVEHVYIGQPTTITFQNHWDNSWPILFRNDLNSRLILDRLKAQGVIQSCDLSIEATYDPQTLPESPCPPPSCVEGYCIQSPERIGGSGREDATEPTT